MLYQSFQNYLSVLEVALPFVENASFGNAELAVLQGSTSIFVIANHFYSTMGFWFVLYSYGFSRNEFNLHLFAGHLEINDNLEIPGVSIYLLNFLLL